VSHNETPLSSFDPTGLQFPQQHLNAQALFGAGACRSSLKVKKSSFYSTPKLDKVKDSVKNEMNNEQLGDENPQRPLKDHRSGPSLATRDLFDYTCSNLFKISETQSRATQTTESTFDASESTASESSIDNFFGCWQSLRRALREES
jgi:hypothetical protein